MKPNDRKLTFRAKAKKLQSQRVKIVTTGATPLCSFAFGTWHSFITGKAGMARKEKLRIDLDDFEIFLAKFYEMSKF